MRIVLGFALFCYAIPAMAAGPAPGQIGIPLENLAIQVSAINSFLHVIILIALQWVQFMLQSDFFSNAAMMGALNNIWQFSRDIMNIIFALMLIGVALYTIVTADKKYVTDKIQTFVIAVILVNFSWFFPRVILDIANITTATVFTLPDLIPGGFQCTTMNAAGVQESCKYIIDLKIFPAKGSEVAFCNRNPRVARGIDCACYGELACYKKGSRTDLQAAGRALPAHVMINGMVTNYMKVLDLVRVPQTLVAPPIGAPRNYIVSAQILMMILITFLIQLAIVLPLIALAIGLLIRILVLWVCIAFMPFAFLGYVMNGKLGSNVFDIPFDVWKEFIAAAFMPTLVALPITFGFVMLNATTSVPIPSSALSFDIPIVMGAKTWWSLLWMATAIMVLWKGAFAALKKSQFVGGITDKIQGYGQYMFGAAAKLPLIAPLPIPGGQNLAGILNTPKKIANAINISAEHGTSIWDTIGDQMKNRKRSGHDVGGVTPEDTANHIDRQRNTQLIVNELEKLKTALAQSNETNRNASIAELTKLLNLEGKGSPKEVLEHLKDVINSGKIKGFNANHATTVTEAIKKQK